MYFVKIKFPIAYNCVGDKVIVIKTLRALTDDGLYHSKILAETSDKICTISIVNDADYDKHTENLTIAGCIVYDYGALARHLAEAIKHAGILGEHELVKELQIPLLAMTLKYR